MSLTSALRLNAVFSFATGFLLVLAPSTVGSWLGVSVDMLLRSLGVGLISHGVALVWASGHSAISRWAKVNVAVVGPYPLIMVALVGTGLVSGTLGRSLVLGDGAIVGALAIAQWAAVRTTASTTHPVSA